MANPLYNEMSPIPNDFMSRLNALKSSVSDPNTMIQQMLNSGRVSQEQYNAAVQQAQQIQQMMRR